MRLFVFASVCVSVAYGIGYDALVDTVVRHAQSAAQRKNAGDEAGADAAVKAALHALQLAKKMDPSHPQAYMTGGTFFLNMNRFEEALDHWNEAKKRLAKGHHYQAHLDERIQHTQLGMVSVQRDQVYQALDCHFACFYPS